MTDDLHELIETVRLEAERAEFPIDTEVYARSGRDPKMPILFAGLLDAPLCIVGRDLGKDEVRAGQPLIGAAGRSVRAGIVRARRQKDPTVQDGPIDDPGLEEALRHALLTNTVPFKPIGNKAYSEAIRERFRPFLERLLVDHWKGHRVITLGTQAFDWFARYGEEAAFQTVGTTDARFETVFRCNLPGHNDKRVPHGKNLMVYPLPHPSPLNRRWFSRFSAMLAGRLEEIWA
jgi:uracil-DNA glycosylase